MYSRILIDNAWLIWFLNSLKGTLVLAHISSYVNKEHMERAIGIQQVHAHVSL